MKVVDTVMFIKEFRWCCQKLIAKEMGHTWCCNSTVKHVFINQLHDSHYHYQVSYFNNVVSRTHDRFLFTSCIMKVNQKQHKTLINSSKSHCFFRRVIVSWVTAVKCSRDSGWSHYSQMLVCSLVFLSCFAMF